MNVSYFPSGEATHLSTILGPIHAYVCTQKHVTYIHVPKQVHTSIHTDMCTCINICTAIHTHIDTNLHFNIHVTTYKHNTFINIQGYIKIYMNGGVRL